MEKYYTPTIEEFHVGFEYEWSADGSHDNWKKEIMDINTPLTYFRDDADVEHRVKYLDKEDIESLGWSTTSSKTNYRHFINSTKSEYDTLQVILECIDEYEHVYDIIRLIIEGGKRHYLFRGIIKNKSELKVLMKQLNLIK